MKRAWFALLLAVVGCDFSGRYEDYCAKSGLCDGGVVEACVGYHQDCAAEPCCGPYVCSQDLCVLAGQLTSDSNRLSVTSEGPGQVVIQSGGSKIGAVPALSSKSYSAPGHVTLLAAPGAGHHLVQWSGACAAAGSSRACELDVRSATQVTATFQ